MLSPSTPFPNVGSYALLQDESGNHLARILERRGANVLVGLPQIDGASGNRLVPLDTLIDASPLTPEETREFHDLDRLLFGRELRNLSKQQRAKKARRDALQKRVIYGPILDRLLRFARARADQQRKAA